MKYIEMPLKAFVKLFPGVLDEMPTLRYLLPDENYLVRYDGNRIEFGYKEDAWLIA